jgi:hypothetical protein
MVVELLPLYEETTTRCCTGFALNVGVRTEAHRDDGDYRKFCIVVAFGNSQGGDICFAELGLRIKLRPGDVVAFMSGELTHFNLPFEGRRVSMVGYTESSFKPWVESYNGASGFFHRKDPSYN